MTSETKSNPKSSPQVVRLDPLREAQAHQKEAERLEKLALSVSPQARGLALELAKSNRAAAKMRQKQAVWEEENPLEAQQSSSPPEQTTPLSGGQADFNL